MEYGFIKNLKILYESFKEILYPSRGICFNCKEDSDNNVSLCNKCISNLNYVSEIKELKLEDLIIKCYCLTYYTGVIKEMILRLKYKSDFECGEALAFLMSDKLKKIDTSIDFITYIPMFKKDEKKRGFNQARYLAKEISKFSNLKIKDFLIKTKQTKDQIGLTKEERSKNIKGCFKAINENIVNNKIILLIDDVFTTGSTSIEGARILKEAGCKEIIVLTVAKSTI